MKEPCDSKCRKKCTSRIASQYRQKAFDEYWSLPNKQEKWNCLNNWAPTKKLQVDSSPARTCKEKGSKDREITRLYSLPVGEKMEPVCQKMFLNTLGN